ncbi:Unknown protein sequence [Pseudomonas ficuserectae]|nr:Unknown protein sequence [Pseudomonas ficuserectae]
MYCTINARIDFQDRMNTLQEPPSCLPFTADGWPVISLSPGRPFDSNAGLPSLSYCNGPDMPVHGRKAPLRMAIHCSAWPAVANDEFSRHFSREAA